MKGDGDLGDLAALRARLVRGAVAAGAAFALWREPGEASVCGLVAAPGETPVGPLDFGAVRPGLAVSRYDNFDGDACRLIAAELLLTTDGLRFVDGDGALADAPQSDVQRTLLHAIETADDAGPAIPSDAPLLAAATPPAVAGEADYRGPGRVGGREDSRRGVRQDRRLAGDAADRCPTASTTSPISSGCATATPTPMSG